MSSLRPLCLLGLALLSACGGGSGASYTLGGSVTGLSSSGLVLSTGDQTLAVASGAGSFTFGSAVSGSYAVTVKSQPVGQTCSVSNGSGSASANVTSVAVVCRNYMAYVGNAGGYNIGQLSVSNGTGLLSSRATVSTAAPVAGLVFSSDGRYAFASYSNAATVGAYAVSSTGALSLIGSVSAVADSRGLAISPDNSHVYVANYTDKTISQFDVNSSTGALSANSAAKINAGSTPMAVTLTPDGSHAYAVNQGDNTVSQYSVGSGGSLTALSTATVSTASAGTLPRITSTAWPPRCASVRAKAGRSGCTSGSQATMRPLVICSMPAGCRLRRRCFSAASSSKTDRRLSRSM